METISDLKSGYQNEELMIQELPQTETIILTFYVKLKNKLFRLLNLSMFGINGQLISSTTPRIWQSYSSNRSVIYLHSIKPYYRFHGEA